MPCIQFSLRASTGAGDVAVGEVAGDLDVLGGDAFDLDVFGHEQRLVAVERAAHVVDHGQEPGVRQADSNHAVPLVVLVMDELMLHELIGEGRRPSP